MTLRRLNLKIQGLPESYAVEPYFDACMVVGEPAAPLHADSVPRSIMPMDHLQPLSAHEDLGMMDLSSAPMPGSASSHLPLDVHDDNDLIDPNLESSSAPSPVPPDLPRSSPLLSKDVGVGDDTPMDATAVDDAPLGIDEEKKE